MYIASYTISFCCITPYFANVVYVKRLCQRTFTAMLIQYPNSFMHAVSVVMSTFIKFTASKSDQSSYVIHFPDSLAILKSNFDLVKE
jgi:hypothetical protein